MLPRFFEYGMHRLFPGTNRRIGKNHVELLTLHRDKQIALKIVTLDIPLRFAFSLANSTARLLMSIIVTCPWVPFLPLTDRSDHIRTYIQHLSMLIKVHSLY